MSAILLAFACALSYGFGDYFGGLATRTSPLFKVLPITVGTGLASLLIAAPFLGADFNHDAVVAGLFAGTSGVVGYIFVLKSLGLGPMGAAATLIANGLGAEVIAIDIMEERLEFAKTLGAKHALNSKNADIKESIMEITKNAGVEIAIDCSGSPLGQNLALDIAGKQGSVAFVGESSKTEINPSDQIIRKLLTVVGGWYFPLGAWSEICDFIVSRGLDVESLISHRFSLYQAEEAFAKFDRRETEKAVFIWND